MKNQASKDSDKDSVEPGPLSSVYATARMLFNVKADSDEAATIESVRANVDFRSANAWTLAFAILIASVGLNVNSTAVVIGAMLISPLMGPIVGAGLALGINDYDLLKRALRNLAYAMVISILTSALYFLISPLSDIQSELLARTRPTFFDVLIAVFGGAAGFIAVSRKERGNAIPGVAIATALMPPLCTAGFGLANAEPKYFIGALYLFVINSVFIFISTYALVRYMGFKKVSWRSGRHERLIHRWVMAIAAIVVAPSLFLAWLLQQETSFKSRANEFIKHELRFPHSFIVGKEVVYDWGKPRIVLDMIGESLSETQMALAKEKLNRYLIAPEVLEIRHTSIEENLEKRLKEKMSTDSKLTAELQTQLTQKELELKRVREFSELSQKITLEAGSILPKIRKVVLADLAAAEVALNDVRPNAGESTEAKDSKIISNSPAGAAFIVWKSAPNSTERNQVQKFLEHRLERTKINTFHSREI